MFSANRSASPSTVPPDVNPAGMLWFEVVGVIVPKSPLSTIVPAVPAMVVPSSTFDASKDTADTVPVPSW
ncbi:hypothetical protein D3C76_980560 [compost metagenome]